MTPKEKAEKLVDKYLTASFGVMEEYIPVPMVLAKQCAIIAVDEIIKLLVDLSDGNFTYVNDVIYYQEVKQEIEKL